MKIYLAAAAMILLTAQGVYAKTNCEILKSDSGGILRKIFATTLEASDEPGSTKMIYMKPDGTILESSFSEIQKRKSFKDLDLSKFYSFKLGTLGNLAIGYGDINIKRKPVRSLISLAEGINGITLHAWADGYAAFCTDKGN